MKGQLPIDVPVAAGAEDWEIATTVEPASARARAQLYHPNAWIPSGFRLPTALERERYVEHAGNDCVGGVSLIRISDPTVQSLREAYARGRRGSPEDGSGAGALSRLMTELSASIQFSGQIRSRPLEEQAPKQWTVARRGALRSGLAVDPSDPNGLCLNLGPDDRWFLWVPVSVSRSGLDALCASVPVLRLRLRPGRGCLAPTGKIFHDGSTLTARRASLTFSLSGRFERR